jgi:hypothetical protein
MQARQTGSLSNYLVTPRCTSVRSSIETAISFKLTAGAQSESRTMLESTRKQMQIASTGCKLASPG